MGRTLSILLLVALVGLAPAAVTHAEDLVPETAWTPAAGNTMFAFDLFRALDAEKGNLFFSPYSVSTALAMTREGARGETASQMDHVLHLPGDGNARGFQALQKALEPPLVQEGWGKDAKKVPAYEFSIANALWGQSGYPIEGKFQDGLRQAFGAQMERVDFADTEAARLRINGWVEKETRDRIKNLIPEGLLTPDAALVLANAIYMKAPWLEPFPKRATTQQPFHLSGGKDVEVSLMRRTDSFLYTESDDVQMVELPYRGRDLSMVVVLPRDRGGLSKLEAQLHASTFNRWKDAMTRQRVQVYLPRFEVTKRLDLTSVLPAMGMSDAFDARKADFTGITAKEPLFIGFVLHKAFVKVDEDGTEAAAATAVGMMRGAARPPEPPIEFRADRPFFFVIRHRPTNSILFMGRLTDPS